MSVAPASIACMTSSPTPHVVALSARSPPVRCQPAGLGALDPGLVALEQHRSGHRVAVGAAHRDRRELAAERLVQHVDEAGAAVGHRGEVELVVGCPAAPAVRDRPGRLDRGEGAGELVRGDQHAHAVTLAGAASVRPTGPAARRPSRAEPASALAARDVVPQLPRACVVVPGLGCVGAVGGDGGEGVVVRDVVDRGDRERRDVEQAAEQHEPGAEPAVAAAAGAGPRRRRPGTAPA